MSCCSTEFWHMAYSLALWIVAHLSMWLEAQIRATLNLQLDQTSRAPAPGAVHHSGFLRYRLPEILALKCTALLLVWCITTLFFYLLLIPSTFRLFSFPRATLPFLHAVWPGGWFWVGNECPLGQCFQAVSLVGAASHPEASLL